MSSILDCAVARWTPGLGDPSPVAWFIVTAYCAASVLAVRRALTRLEILTAERVFWWLAGLYLAVLAVNKQLDLQTFVTHLGRCAARLQGWYDIRREVQVAVILSLVAASLLAGLLALWIFRWTLRRTWLALVGLVWITSFVLVRAVGFHHVDRLIATPLSGIRVNWAFEVGGIALFLLGTLLAGRRAPAARKPAPRKSGFYTH